MKRVLVWALLGALFPATASAAEIVTSTVSSFNFISVSGELTPGDDDRFKSIAISLDKATVLLEGPGGSADVGMEIGKTIAIKGFSTAVGAESICASACGLIWLAGRERFLQPTSLVGFHAIYRAPDGTPQVSSDGNALVGSYLRQLGFDDAFIVYATQALPTSMQWLTFDDAARYGVRVTRVDKDPIGRPEQTMSADLGVNAGYLYVEKQGSSSPTVYSASVRWMVKETETPSFGVQKHVYGLIEVQQFGLFATLTAGPNLIESLPATHLFRLQPSYGPGYSGSRITSLRGISMKATEAERGDALLGVTETLPEGFVLATNEADEALARNFDLLSRPWIDIPITLDGRTRALLTLEVSGMARQAFDGAISDWRRHAAEAER